MKILEEYGIDIEYVVLGLVAAVLVMFIMLIVMMIRNHIMRKRYKQFMS